MRLRKRYLKRGMAAVLAAVVMAGSVPVNSFAVPLQVLLQQESGKATPSEAAKFQNKATLSEAQKATPSIAAMSLDEIWGDAKPLELENGRILDPENSKKVRILSQAGFSGGKYVDSLNEAGPGAGISVYSDNDKTGYFRISLQYARGSMIPADGRLGFYVNDQYQGEFILKKGDVNAVRLSENTFIVKLEPGDELSILAEEGNYKEDAVGRLDCLLLERWGGKCEAEEGELLLMDGEEFPAVTENGSASGGKLVSKFVDGMGETAEPHAGSGVAFPGLAVPADDKYQLVIRYMRSGSYEYMTEPSLYINDEFFQTVNLAATENTDTFYTSSPIKLDLLQGDILSLRIDGNGTMKDDFGLDYVTLDVVPSEAEEKTETAFYDSAFRVIEGTTFTIPVVNASEGMEFTYSTDDANIAEVDEHDGAITAGKAGSATITARSNSGEDTKIEFSAVVEVVAEEDDLFPEVITYEAEDQTLLKGSGGKALQKTVYDADDYYSLAFFPGGYVSDFSTAGSGSGIQFEADGIEAGLYDIALRYSSRSHNDSYLKVMVNNKKTGAIELPYTPTGEYPNGVSENWAPAMSKPITVSLKAGDEIKILTDKVKESIPVGVWLDSIMIVPHAVIVPTSVSMEESVELAVNEVTTLPVEAKPTQKPDKQDWKKWVLWNRTASNEMVWSVEGSDLVDVDQGFITAKAEGNVELKVSSLFDDDISAVCTVSVMKNDKLAELKNEVMTVTLDKTFPRVVQYKMNATGNTMDGSHKNLHTVKVNGQEYQPDVTFEMAGDNEAHYKLTIAELNAVIHMTARAEANLFKLDITDITESGENEKRVFTVEFPELDIVSVSSKDEGAQFAGANIVNNVTESGDTILDLYKDQKADSISLKYAYAFLSNGKIAAGINSNALGSDSTIMGSGGTYHLNKQTVAEGGSFRTGLSSIPWVWRRKDYTKKFQDIPGRYPDEHTVENGVDNMVNKVYQSEPEQQKPLLYVALAEDLNGDEMVDWQDGAVAYREIMHHVRDEEKVPDMVVQRLVQQQANSGNYPFIAMLDETRRVSLNTDNLGQMINDKFHNEAYWGDFTHYDDHLGGWRDFKYMVDESTEKYNGYVGVHSNFYEYFAKAEQFSPELTSMKQDGITPNNKGYKAYGAWMHQCYNIDTVADTLSGDRLRRMKIFKEDIPNLGFIYNDVWYNTGWEGRRIGENYRDAEIGYCVEWPYVNFEDAIWSHWAVERGYGGAEDKGIMSDIMRFVWNHTRDRWDNNDLASTAGREANARNLLMGADTTTYEGWQNYAGSTNRYDRVIQKIFEDNLPTKFMQHFPITRMEKDEEGWASHIWFEDGVEVYYEGEDPWNRMIAVNGSVIYTPEKFLIPWDDGELGGDVNLAYEPTKFYHWNREGGESSWTLPVDWSGTVYLYELSDQGKKNEKAIEINGGQITLSDIKKNVPYVLCRERQETGNSDAAFGEGSYVKDPGFNYGDLREWTVEYGNPEVKRNYSAGDDSKFVMSLYGGELRNYELIMEGAEAAAVSQKIEGLTPGESYAVTAMVEIEQGHRRKASLEAECGGIRNVNYADSSTVVVAEIYDSKANTYMQRIRTEFMVPAGVSEATIRLRTDSDESEDPAIVRFDNVRVYDCTIKTSESYAPNTHADGTKVTGKIIAYQDYENTKRKDELIENEKGRDSQKNEFEVWYPLVMGQGQLDGGNYAQQYRSFLVSKHEPYTQNGLIGSQWDPNTTGTDDVLAGDRSLRIYGTPLGVAFQTMPQTVRFKEGRTYRISFLYQYRKAREGDMEFVIGEGQIPRNESHNPNSSCIKRHVAITATSPAETEETRTGKFFYEFTSESDDTWIGINRAVYFDMWEDPCPFQLDNLMIEEISKGEPEPEVKVTVKVETTDHGTIKVIDVSDSTEIGEGVEQSVLKGTPLKIAAVPEEGYELKELTVNGQAVQNDTIFAAEDNMVIRATFGVMNQPEDQQADKKLLQKLLEEAKTRKKEDYTEESWELFAEKLEKAVRVNNDEEAEQKAVDIAAEELQTTMDNLKNADEKPEPDRKPKISVILPPDSPFSSDEVNIEGIDEALGLTEMAEEGKQVTVIVRLEPGKEAHAGDREKLEGLLTGKSRIAELLSISLYLDIDGVMTDVDSSKIKGNIKFTIPLEGKAAADKNYEVWSIPSDGAGPEKVESRILDGGKKMVFWLDYFSTVAVVEKAKSTAAAGTGSSHSSSSYKKAAGTWKKDGTGWWYDKGGGKYDRSSWAMINGKWYYFDQNGYMKTGWVLLNEKWYYLRPDKDGLEGSMVTGWNLINEKWYYMEADGSMAADQWLQGKDGKWYYVQPDGSMAKSTVIQGKYRVDENGVWDGIPI